MPLQPQDLCHTPTSILTLTRALPCVLQSQDPYPNPNLDPDPRALTLTLTSSLTPTTGLLLVELHAHLALFRVRRLRLSKPLSVQRLIPNPDH